RHIGKGMGQWQERLGFIHGVSGRCEGWMKAAAPIVQLACAIGIFSACIFSCKTNNSHKCN
ncbi:MAG TPA: hypothetical protein VGC24_11920, partial [Burkholderiaceae bacterium]